MIGSKLGGLGERTGSASGIVAPEAPGIAVHGPSVVGGAVANGIEGGIVSPMANHFATTLNHRMRSPASAEPVPFGVDAGMETQLTVHADAEEEFHPDPNAPPDPAVIRQIEEEIPRLRRFARAMVRDATLADDLVQECLERALSRLHLWRPGTNLRAWLFTILRNLHINGVRRRQPVVDIDAEAQAAIGAAPGSQFVRMELRDLRRALALLPNEQREVVLLIGLEGIAYNEAADILGISIGTVKSRLSRGRRALRLLMEGQDPSGNAAA
ncbi:RNA polymerase sigma factor [Azospirillum sp. B510]|uniref:RNA polymerase sigma factor n=1 Tax=Azospirillum sp. (strain B510) TaxID=137722 RepID=UPI0002F463F1|nr:RNA polymerase sigma factor [Azospirillum sp. B510]